MTPVCPHLLQGRLERSSRRSASRRRPRAARIVPRSSAALQAPEAECDQRRPGACRGRRTAPARSRATTRSWPRPRRSTSAATDRSSSSGVTATTSAPWRQRPRGDHVDVLPRVAELDAGLEKRVHEPVALDCPLPARASAGCRRTRRARRGRGAGGTGPPASRPPHGVLERSLVRLARASAKLSRKTTTSAFRSGWRSLTTRLPRRAVARQFTERTRSPRTNGRVSANSSPSARSRATSLPVAACVWAGATSFRSAQGSGTP